jgi:hypothetical protein
MRKKLFRSLPSPNDSSRYGTSEFRLSDWPYQRPCTKKELAQEVRATERFIEHEVTRGNLRAVRLGLRSVSFLPSDVVRWLNARPIAGSEEVVAEPWL